MYKITREAIRRLATTETVYYRGMRYYAAHAVSDVTWNEATKQYHVCKAAIYMVLRLDLAKMNRSRIAAIVRLMQNIRVPANTLWLHYYLLQIISREQMHWKISVGKIKQHTR